MLVFPCKFGDSYEVESRGKFEGKTMKYKAAVVTGIKITPGGTEVTLLVPVGEAVLQEDDDSTNATTNA